MKVNSLYSHINNQKNCPVFKWQIVNGRVYTDDVYSDAYLHKNWSYVGMDMFEHRFSFFEYWFTTRCERYTQSVNDCIKDIRAEEQKRIALLKEKLAREAEKKLLEEELAKQKELLDSKSAPTNFSKEFENCTLSKEQKTEIAETLLSPVRIADSNDDACETIPNGILLRGGSKEQRKNISLAIAKEVLGKNYPNNFIKIKNLADDSIFEEYMMAIQEKAKDRFENKHQRTVLFMENFGDFAAEIDSDIYNPKRNSFLKNYFLECADNGCLVIATADDTSSIEAPFIINKKRFGLTIEL